MYLTADRMEAPCPRQIWFVDHFVVPKMFACCKSLRSREAALGLVTTLTSVPLLRSTSSVICVAQLQLGYYTARSSLVLKCSTLLLVVIS